MRNGAEDHLGKIGEHLGVILEALDMENEKDEYDGGRQ